MKKVVTNQLKSTDATSAARLAVSARFSFRNIMKEELIKLMTLSEKKLEVKIIRMN